MKHLFSRDVPTGAAVTIVALVLAASVVTGRDTASPVSAIVEPVTRQAEPTTQSTPRVAEPDLAIERLQRTKRDQEVADLFAQPAPAQRIVSAAVALKPAKPTPPPPPAAPSLPFRYLGRMVDGSTTVAFLAKGNDTLAVRPGETIDGTWRIDAVTRSSISITYVPLKIAQQLAIAAAP